MTELQLDVIAALKKLAEAATPGPWQTTTEADRPVGLHVNGRSLLMRDSDGLACVDRREDAAFIAAANPTVVLALIALITEPLIFIKPGSELIAVPKAASASECP